ncbi:glycosyl hydrolase family 61 [Stagonosporopsis vannaccii]|nr:glycosyl hydrolase family 61 [Stagonosporopsis vannaccii]
MLSKIATVAAFAAGAMAHGTVNGVTIDGKFEQGWIGNYYYANDQGQPVADHIGWYAENLDNGFVEPAAFGEPDIICHKAGSPKLSSDTMASVAAGGTVEFHWTTWPESHVGPVITYVAPYTGDVEAVDKTTLQWTKIQANGYENGEWAAVKMIGQNNTWPVTVPEALAPGKYVFRHEIIALHGAQAVNGAQNYPQCLNIEVTGSGTETPEGVVGTKLYTENEDGIVFNPYAATIEYNIPGPALWTGGSGSGSGSSPAPPTSGNGTAPATPTAPAETSAAASSAPAATSVAAEATPTASATPAPSAGSELPKTFTLETFIAWLEEAAGSAGSAKARRHARSFF